MTNDYPDNQGNIWISSSHSVPTEEDMETRIELPSKTFKQKVKENLLIGLLMVTLGAGTGTIITWILDGILFLIRLF